MRRNKAPPVTAAVSRSRPPLVPESPVLLEQTVGCASSSPSSLLAGHVITATGYSLEERNKLVQKITSLGGNYNPNLTHECGYLLAEGRGGGGTLSAKYKVAASLKMKIVRAAWIDDLFANKSSIANNNPSHEQLKLIMEKHLLPPLVETLVCVTGLSQDERKAVEELVVQMGGVYSPDLTKTCTHLVAKSSEGRKFEFAAKWGLQIVTADWIYACQELGACANEDDYRISSPQKKPGISNAVMNSTSNYPASSQVMETQQFMDATNNNFLTSYFFFFGGDLSLTTKRSLNDFITRHGGIVTANYSIDKDLHFIVQGTHSTSHDDSLLNSYRKRPLYLINQLWIRECEKNRSIVDMKPFLIKEILPALTKRQQIQLNKNVLSSSTLSHNNNYFSKSSSTSKLVANTIQAAVVSSSSSASNFSRKNSGGGVGGIVIKASRRQNSASNLLNLDDFLFKNNTSTQSNSAIGNIVNTTTTMSSKSYLGVSMTAAESTEDIQPEGTLFRGMGFCSFGFDDKDKAELLKTLITKQSGTYYGEPRYFEQDIYVVVCFKSKESYKPLMNETVVTEHWIEMCLNENKLLGLNDHVVFRPLPFNEPIKGFKRYNISITGYEGMERVFIGFIAERLGANFSEKFSKKSTHLICSPGTEKESMKYKKALEWRVTLTTADWLYRCAETAKNVPIIPFNSESVKSSSSLLMDSSVAVATVAAKPGTSHHLHQHHRATTIASYNNDEPSASSIIVTGDTHCTTMPATAPTPSLHLNFDTDAALEKLKEMSQLADNADNSSSNNNHTPNKDAIIDNVASGDTPLDISFSNNLKQIAETLKGAATTGIRFKKAPQFSESDSGSGEEEKQQRMDIPISVDAIENDQVNQATGVVFSKVSSIFDGGEVLAYCSSKVVGLNLRREISTLLKTRLSSQLTPECTHLIYQSSRPLSESLKEVSFAKSNSMRIVSPYWVMESAWRSQLLPESEFPPAYDPKRCLSMLPSSSASSAISTQKLLNASPPPRPPRSATSEESVKDDWGNADDTIRNYYSNYKDLVACAPSTSARTPCSENRVEVSASTPEEAVQDALAVEVVETKAVENIVDTVMVNELLLETMKKSGKDRRRKNAEGGDDAVMQKVDQRQPLSEIFVSTTNLYGETDSPDMIAYDDPEERMAKRKLLEEVQKNNKKIKSDQEEAITAAEASAARATVSAPLVSTNTSDSISSSRHHEPSEQLQPSNTITTSINTSLSLKQDRNPTMGIPSSSSWSVIPEQQSRTTKLANTRNYVFCMSGVKRNVKVLSAGISNLGGVLLDDDTWGKGFTHLICDKPTKTGKCLAAIACGSWVLRPSFVLDSVENGAWLPEEQYEWAGDTTRKPLDYSVSERDALMASRRWRKKLQRSNSSMCFEGWRVMLMGETSKIEGFSRVLGVGGASVTCIRGDEDIVELSDVMKFTLVLADSADRLESTELMKSLVKDIKRANIPITDYTFVCDYLQKPQTPSASDSAYHLKKKKNKS